MTEPERRILTRAMPNPYPWPTDLPPERAILTDLIAELRDWDSYYCKAAAADIADRAEARLREVQGE